MKYSRFIFLVVGVGSFTSIGLQGAAAPVAGPLKEISHYGLGKTLFGVLGLGGGIAGVVLLDKKIKAKAKELALVQAELKTVSSRLEGILASGGDVELREEPVLSDQVSAERPAELRVSIELIKKQQRALFAKEAMCKRSLRLYRGLKAVAGLTLAAGTIVGVKGAEDLWYAKNYNTLVRARNDEAKTLQRPVVSEQEKNTDEWKEAARKYCEIVAKDQEKAAREALSDAESSLRQTQDALARLDEEARGLGLADSSRQTTDAAKETLYTDQHIALLRLQSNLARRKTRDISQEDNAALIALGLSDLKELSFALQQEKRIVEDTDEFKRLDLIERQHMMKTREIETKARLRRACQANLDSLAAPACTLTLEGMADFYSQRDRQREANQIKKRIKKGMEENTALVQSAQALISHASFINRVGSEKTFKRFAKEFWKEPRATKRAILRAAAPLTGPALSSYFRFWRPASQFKKVIRAANDFPESQLVDRAYESLMPQ